MTEFKVGDFVKVKTDETSLAEMEVYGVGKTSKGLFGEKIEILDLFSVDYTTGKEVTHATLNWPKDYGCYKYKFQVRHLDKPRKIKIIL